jgi:adenosylcobinamide kinase / adenosylcobinamide-phosphate guanylyltransferase
VAACREHEGTVVLVTNEVGLGIIPENPAARLYRDLLGRCNQVIAAAADTVILMVAGLPIVVKDEAGGATP